MNRMRHALSFLFLVSLGLGAPPRSAAGDPVESDTFKFTWLGVPIGEVTLHYGSYEDPKRAYGPKPAALTGTPARMLERQSRELSDGEHEDQKSVQSLRLGWLEGRTNGLVRWLKRYEGVYRTTLTPSGSRYEVTAMDQGVPEVRDIWFGAKHADTPKVLDFRDRSSAYPLQPLTGVDEGSVDPVRLMALILQDIELHDGCPATPKTYRVFDGKRRYEARLSEQNWVDTSVLIAQADTNVALESSVERGLPSAASLMTSSGGLSASGKEAGTVSRNGAASAPGAGVREESVGDQDRHQLKLTAVSTTVVQESEGLLDRGLQNLIPRTVECQLMLTARDAPKDLRGETKRSEVNARGEVVLAKSFGQSPVDPIDLREQRGVAAEIAPPPKVAEPSTSLEYADSQNSARETEYKEGRQGQDVTTQRGLFWPFNRQDLTIDFSVSLNGDGARFRSFLIRAPVGQIKGRRINSE